MVWVVSGILGISAPGLKVPPRREECLAHLGPSFLPLAVTYHSRIAVEAGCQPLNPHVGASVAPVTRHDHVSWTRLAPGARKFG